MKTPTKAKTSLGGGFGSPIVGGSTPAPPTAMEHFAEISGHILNAGGLIWGGSEVYEEFGNLRKTAYNIGKATGFRSGDAYRGLKGLTNIGKGVGAKIGHVGYALSAISFVQQASNGTLTIGGGVNFGIGTALYFGAMYGAGTAAAPWIAAGALTYGTVQLLSYGITGNTIEDNIFGK